MAKSFLEMCSPRKGRKPAQAVAAVESDLGAEIVAAARRLAQGRVAAFPSLRNVYFALLNQPTHGQFHDAVRLLLAAGRVRMHPYTGPQWRMNEEGCEFAMILGCEIMNYLETL